jgi:hypothetical protein
LGRNLQEVLTDWMIRNWDHVRTGILPGLFGFIIDFFRWLIEMVERLLYTVDEWLRFKGGEGRLSLVVKASLGVVWFYVTYLVRFCFNLLIEPQINPIKHFPVVTVSHKLLLPTIPSVANLLQAATDWDPKTAAGVATTVVTSIPGIFGFLVWELKENWKLYRANRPVGLKPVIIGHHGETMLRLMKPGFHSGTLPKLFARLRKAERRAHKHRNWKAVHHQLEAVHHIEDSVRRFLDRELIELLRESKAWGGTQVKVSDVEVSSNRVRVDIGCSDLGDEPLRMAFEEHAGWLVAGITRPGWMPLLSPGQGRVLRNALAGLYKMAGIHLVREQIEDCLGPSAGPYEINGDGLVVWPGGGFDTEAFYDLGNGEFMGPRNVPEDSSANLPVLEAGRILYQRTPVTWERWVEAWEADQAGVGALQEVAEGVRLLPTVSARELSRATGENNEQ